MNAGSWYVAAVMQPDGCFQCIKQKEMPCAPYLLQSVPAYELASFLSVANVYSVIQSTSPLVCYKSGIGNHSAQSQVEPYRTEYSQRSM